MEGAKTDNLRGFRNTPAMKVVMGSGGPVEENRPSLQSVVELLETWSLMSLGKPIVWDFIPPGHHDLQRAMSKKDKCGSP